MKITAIELQARADNRVNIYIDGKYSFSLDVFQLGETGLKVGREINETELAELKQAAEFGKLYARAVEYCLSRPHSSKEIKDYLYRKTLAKKVKTRQGKIINKPGVSQAVADMVFARLNDKGYINDEAFVRWWVEGRKLRAGISQHQLRRELMMKGIGHQLIDEALNSGARSDDAEIKKVIDKKAGRYSDPQKLVAYLLRQGFSYDLIKQHVEF